MEIVKTADSDSSALSSPPPFAMAIEQESLFQGSPASASVSGAAAGYGSGQVHGLAPRQSSPMTIPPSSSFSANSSNNPLAAVSMSMSMDSSAANPNLSLMAATSPHIIHSPSPSLSFQPAPAASPSSLSSSAGPTILALQSQSQSQPPLHAIIPASQSLDELLAQYLPFTELPVVKLHHTSQQRAQYDQLADVFALLTSIEHLEHAYVRDAITANEYTASCNKMLAQMKTLREALVNDLPDLNRFVHDFSLTVPAAMKRIEAGVPATVLHGDIGKADSGGKELAVFHGVQHFITAMDSLKLGLKAVDELYPHLSDLMDAINKVSDLPNDHEAKTKVRQWLTTLANMRAHEEISADQQRQMAFDLDTAYSSFHKFVKQGRKE